jgi:hypothetical protein
MRPLLEPLPIGQGALITAALSTGAALLCRLRVPQWFVIIVIPFLIAFCLFWLPVWLNAPWSEFWHLFLIDWSSLLYIGPWLIAGASASAVMIRILDRHRRV